MCPFIWCVFNDTPRHYASIPAYIPGVHRGIIPHTIPDVYPRCVSRRAPDVHSVLHLRSNLTFGHILPRILEQVLCPRCSTFISIFITFIPFHSISMFERFMNCIVSFHMVCRLRYTASFTIHCVVYDTLRRLRYTSPLCINPATIPGDHPRRASRRAPDIHPAPNPFYIFGPILPSVQSYRGF